MPDVASDLGKLKIERGQCKAKITRFETYLHSVRSENIFQLESRLNDISKLLEIFNEIQLRIEILDPDELENDERQNFEDKYYDVTSIAMQKIRDFQSQSAQQPCSPASTNMFKSNVKLPTMQLPTFDGNYDQWEHFRDMFLALVDQDLSIDNIRKFYYLSTALTGAAAKVIKSISVTSDNYAVAWQLLKDRFEDKDIIIGNHVKAIVEMRQVSGDLKNSLREFTDDLQVHIRSLESLGEPVDQWSSLLNYIIWKKLDTDTQNDWEEFLVSKKIKRPDHATFINFLLERCKFLEKKDNSSNNEINRVSKQNKTIENREKSNSSKFQTHKKPAVSHFAGKRDSLCQHCGGEHYIYFCNKLKDLSGTARLAEIKRLNLCINCLRSNHRSNECTAGGCKKCSKKHNTMLHFENANKSGENDSKSQRVHQGASTVATSVTNETSNIATEENREFSLICSKREKQILLSTAIVSIRDVHGNWHVCRVLLDSGSQPNFITKSLCSKLHLKTNKTNVPVLGVGKSTANVLSSTRTHIKSLQENFSIDLTFLILEKITENLPLNHFNKSSLEIPSNIVLADNSFNVSEKIDLLLGAEIFYSLLKSNQILLGPGLPILQSTVLGWIVSGPLPKNIGTNKKVCTIAINDLNFDLERFWNLEEIRDKPDLSLEEKICENRFISTTNRDESGRFTVTLPFKENEVIFGDSLDNAIKRLHGMERKFSRDPVFKKKYNDFMTEYEDLGHMTRIDPSEFSSHSGCVFYLPHHGVLNENSSTTKLRVVFDGSCKSSNGLSLNEALLVGPTLQDDLFSILTRFRKHNFVVTADIAKMYRQVMITESERDYQRVVWRKTTEEPIGHYRLNTVTYGTSSASYLAIRSLQQVGLEIKAQNPIASEVILSDFYVDDLLTGSATRDSAIALKSDLIGILNSYGFPLRKWAANDKDILKGSTLDETDNYQILDNETKKTLGMWWQAYSDNFTYKINTENATSDTITKRIILSSTAKLFDPLGLLSPVILQAKIILQRLWQLKVGWDDPLPNEMTHLWLNFIQGIPEIENITIPRQVMHQETVRIELHGFSDASEVAYGACIYIKSVNRQNRSKIILLCSKSRVAPLRALSLPRLELCGAVLLVKLYKKVVEAMKLQFDEIFFWTDSSIVLSWLKAPPNSWKIFVANRVSEIQTYTDTKQWAHVSSGDNPADLVSRGIQPNRLSDNQLWWNGPTWLSLEREFWPKSAINCSDAPEKRKRKVISLTAASHDFSIFERYSSLYKLKRIVALCFRFFDNCRSVAIERRCGPISLEEIENSFKVLLKLAQTEAFNDEVKALSRKESIPKVSKLRSLNPFKDSDQLIRVGGRIANSELPFETVHPVILPANHRLTKLIILNEHYRHIHAGAQAILNSLRQRFWPIDGRATIRGVLRKCLVCRRVKPLTLERQMGNLPHDRVTPNRPFLISGVDFAGPFLIKDGKLRNRAITKAYLCLFICFSTKAVHLETVSDLSSYAFLSSLKRFISRRGICKTLYSDNGTNFVGANKLLQSTRIENFLLENRIEWKFIPPQSPHQGGLWEASIKIAKFHAKRVIGESHLTFEDLATLFCQIEAIMNSRPITPLSPDPNDLSALTPGHFLIGSPLLALPQTDFTNVPPNRLKHFERLQQMIQHFWQRWSKEYLLALQQRTKWQSSNNTPLNVGDLVVLINENGAPQDWKMGRIVELHPGRDGIARVVSIKTATGSTKRAVQKICKLPLEDPLC